MSDLNERLAKAAGWRPYGSEPSNLWKKGGILTPTLDAEHSIDAQASYEAIARARGWRLFTVYEYIGGEGFGVQWSHPEHGSIAWHAPTEAEARARALLKVLEAGE